MRYMAKWCEIGPRLLLITNRKSHIGCQITCKSSTLDDLEGNCQPVLSAILVTAGLVVIFRTVFFAPHTWCIFS